MTDDKQDATFHPGSAPVPPWADLVAQQGQAPASPSPVGPAPWGTLSQDIGHEPPRKRRRVWPWVLVALALVAMCAVGSLAVLAGGSKAVVDTVNQQAADRKADIKITSCSVGEFNLATVKFTIHNSSDEAQSYLPQFNIQGTDGTVYGQAADAVNALAPGKDYKGSAVGSAEVPAKTKIVCSLADA